MGQASVWTPAPSPRRVPSHSADPLVPSSSHAADGDTDNAKSFTDDSDFP